MAVSQWLYQEKFALSQLSKEAFGVILRVDSRIDLAIDPVNVTNWTNLKTVPEPGFRSLRRRKIQLLDQINVTRITNEFGRAGQAKTFYAKKLYEWHGVSACSYYVL